MPDFDFRLTAVAQPLDSGVYLAEALFFPEVALIGRRLGVLHEALQANARILTESLPPEDLFRRHAAGAPETAEVTLDLPPPPRSVAWRRPVSLTFPVVRWAHGSAAHVAYVPALGIVVLAESADDLNTLLPEHIHAALLRMRAGSLGSLVWLQRCRKLRLHEMTFSAHVLTPR
ncbi:MAG TPA: hypothetical protein VKD72_26950, partial [Gemmataceae bacterium]|nr:hypothetical protein [Gemmataceae bacterium]